MKNKKLKIAIGVILSLLFINTALLKFIKNSESAESSSSHSLTEKEKIDEASSKWQYYEQEDKMRGTVDHYASLLSKNHVDLKFPYQGGSYLNLVLRNTKDNGNEIYIETNKGQIICDYRDCSINIKFENVDLIKFPANKASDGNSNILFIRLETLFLVELKKSSKMYAEVTMFDNGVSQFEFDIPPLVWDYK